MHIKTLGWLVKQTLLFYFLRNTDRNWVCKPAFLNLRKIFFVTEKEITFHEYIGIWSNYL